MTDFNALAIAIKSNQKDKIDEFLYSEVLTNYLHLLRLEHAPFEEQLAWSVRVLEENPLEVDAWYFMAGAYQSAGMVDEQFEAIQEGLKILDEHEIIQTLPQYFVDQWS